MTKRFFDPGERIGGTNYYFTRNHLGSVREMTDTTGAIRARYDYNLYGRTTKVSGDMDADFGFTGHYYHACSGLYLALYRAYDPETGRWISKNPMGEGGDFNLYLYCHANPVNGVDPSGLKTFLIFVGEDNTSIFKDQSKRHAAEIQAASGIFDPSTDSVVITETYTVSAMVKALQTNTDIGYMAYFGQGGPSALYLGLPSGKDYNLSPWGGTAGGASDSTAIKNLPTENVRIDAWMNLFSCDSASAEPGGVSMAKAFADHFGISVQGAGAGVGFNENGPYICNWRIVNFWRENIMGYKSGGGGKWIKPDFVSPAVP